MSTSPYRRVAVLWLASFAVLPSWSWPGKKAVNTPLDGPMDLAIDHHGHLFVREAYNNKIYRIDLRRKTILPVAGNGKECCYKDGMKATKVSLDFIEALTVDSADNLLIGAGRQVKKVDMRTGLISTIAGDGKSADTTEGAPALLASFKNIDALAVSPEDDLFIADGVQQKIFRVDAKSGKVFRVAGSGKEGFDGDAGPALDASFRHVGSMALDKDENLFLADDENCRVRRIDRQTGIISTVIQTGQNCPLPANTIPVSFAPSDLVFSSAGDLYFIQHPSDRVMRMDVASPMPEIVAGGWDSGFTGDGGPASEAEFSGLAGLAIDTDGNLFISDCRNNRVRRVDARTKTITTIAGNGLPHIVHPEL
jgi:DNA-binding beta-propeller fold protein YncE